ncbi:MAG: hypothetical protein ACHQ53_06930 [Polyangiales bacterium]
MASRSSWLFVLLGVLVLGVWLRSTALDAGFWSDDYLHHAMLEHAYPNEHPSWDLFHFAEGTAAATKRLTDFGYYPWWAHPQFRLSMLRPLPSMLHALDWRLLGQDARRHHLHSFVWWALMVSAVCALLFSVLPRGAAAAASVLFALDESHTVPLVWLSNRSSLIATAFGAAALLAHVRWRRGARHCRPVSIALFALALASGEYALTMFGYLVCFELGSRFEGQTRARALAPALGLALTFVVLSAALGYGTAHSGLYTSPLQAPFAYASKLGAGLPVMLGDLAFGVPADFWSFGSPWPAQVAALRWVSPETWARLPSWSTVQWSLGALAGACAILLLRWLSARLPPDARASLRWLFGGALFALLPVLGSFVTTRLVLPASIGFAALFGSAVCVAARGLRAEPSKHPVRALGSAALLLAVLYVHGYRSATASVQSVGLYSYVALSRTAWPAAAQLDDTTVAKQRVVMVSAADANDAVYLPFVRFAQGHPMPKGFRLLGNAPCAYLIDRVDPYTIDLTALDPESLRASVVGSLTRAESDQLHVGERFDVAGLQVEVLALTQGQPSRLRCRFDVQLEDSSLVFLESTPGGLKRLALPRVGTSAQLAAPMMPDLGTLLRAQAAAQAPR